MTTFSEEEKRLALQNAQLDVTLKQTEIAEKQKPWRTLAQPTTLMALLAALTTLTTATVTMLQYYGQKDSEEAQRMATELTAERGLVANIVESTPDQVALRAKLTALAMGGMLNSTKDGLIKAGWIDPRAK